MTDAKVFFKKRLNFLLEPLLTKAVIKKIVRINSSFALLEIKAQDPKMKWQPGDQIQIEIGNFQDRAYTPFEVDVEKGLLKILCFQRQSSPASDWLRSLSVRDSCPLFGPRTSFKIPGDKRSVVFIGDETTIGLAKGIQSSGCDVQLFLEAQSPLDTENAFEYLGLSGITMAATSDDTHLPRLADAALGAFSKDPERIFLLCGRVKSIQILRSLLMKASVSAGSIKTKAYWAEGKVGKN